MQQERLPELGEEFAAISSGVCGISPFTAKLILYNELDDGYGRYFHDIFSQGDREQPYLVQELGSPTPQRQNDISKKCVAMAKEFIQSRQLTVGAWRRSWEDVALCGDVSKRLQKYQNGSLGNLFISYIGGEHSFVDAMVAKRALLDVLACSGAEDKIFTREEMGSFLYSSLLMSDEWCPSSVSSSQYVEMANKKAAEFAVLNLGTEDGKAPFVGVTFGWPAKDYKEWHLYGDLVTTDLFRCNKQDLPYLFGMACFDAPSAMLEKLYNATYLCVVAVDAAKRSLPDKVGSSFVYNFPLTDVVSCKWVGTLSNVFGPYKYKKKGVAQGFLKFKREGAYNA